MAVRMAALESIITCSTPTSPPASLLLAPHGPPSPGPQPCTCRKWSVRPPARQSALPSPHPSAPRFLRLQSKICPQCPDGGPRQHLDAAGGDGHAVGGGLGANVHHVGLALGIEVGEGRGGGGHGQWSETFLGRRHHKALAVQGNACAWP